MPAWPLATDYDAAVQNPASCFTDAELASGQAATTPLGLPLTYAGNFANVYKIESDESAWAVKCFTREATDRQQRYAAISEHLERNRRKFAVEFRFLDEGIKIKGATYPALKMRWIEGFTLNEFLRDHAGNSSLLEQLMALWLRLGNELRESKMAHGDLQHGNVLLVPGGETSKMVLRLIDYDGMWIPALADTPPGEVGHPNFQHPQRLREGGYDAEIDRFSHLVIATAFRCLMSGGTELWNDFDNSENLLFRAADFRDPEKSKLWPRLFALADPHAASLAGHLLAAACGPLDRVPLTSELLAEGKVPTLNAEQRELIRVRVPNYRAAKPVAPPPPPPVPDWVADAPAIPPARRSTVVLRPIEVPVPAIPVAESYPEAIPLVPLPPRYPGVVVIDPWAVPEAKVISVEPPTLPITRVVPVEPVPILRPLPPPIPVPSAKLPPAKPPLFPAPDWLVGVGLPPDSPVVRYWPICLGVLLGLPMVIVLLWLLWPSSKRPVPRNEPGTPAPKLRGPGRVELKAGRSVEVEFRIERFGPDSGLKLDLTDLPANVRVEPSVLAIEPGRNSLSARLRLVASLEVGTSSSQPKAILHCGPKRVEIEWPLVTRQFLRPTLASVSAIKLAAGHTTPIKAKVSRNGNDDPLTLEVDPLPAKVVARQPSEDEEGSVGLLLETDPSAEAVVGERVTLTLRAGGLLADQKTVSLSIEPRRGNPQALLQVVKQLNIRAGTRRTVEVRVERRDYDGVLRLEVENLPDGVTADSIDIPAGQDAGTLTLVAAATATPPPGLSPRFSLSAYLGNKRIGREHILLTVEPAAKEPKAVLPVKADPPRPEEVRISTGDGLVLKGTYYAPPDARKGVCVLMLPDLRGVGRRDANWRMLALSIQRRGAAVLALDFRGFGENAESDEPVSSGFLKVPANSTALSRPLAAQLRMNNARLQTMKQLPGTIFPTTYYPWLVQDIVAARLWLDLKHDREEVNSSNLVLIAEGDSALLAKLWLATELRRYKSGGLVPGMEGHHFESRDLIGALWIEPRSKFDEKSLTGLKSVDSVLSKEGKNWPAMRIVYDGGPAASKANARAWLKTFGQEDKAGAEKAIEFAQGFGRERSFLAGKGAPEAVVEYVAEVSKREPRAWGKRDAQNGTYIWHMGVNRSSEAKPARATVPGLCPMDYWGFAGLKIQ